MTIEELSKLTAEEKRVMIATARGWTKVDVYEWNHEGRKPRQWHCLEALPDYLSDLNAMHKAEKALTTQQHYTFRVNLWSLTDCSQDRSWHGVNGEEHNRRYCSAAAEQRADAFLLTTQP